MDKENDLVKAKAALKSGDFIGHKESKAFIEAILLKDKGNTHATEKD